MDLPMAVMTNEQLYLMIGIPIVFHALTTGLLIVCLNMKFTSLEEKLKSYDQP
jgi:hypothetical protein